jgi:hypothetical protein
VPFNDLAAAERAVARRADDLAAIILEPINYDSDGIRPLSGYLQALRDLTHRAGAVLIFDEILSGFRTGPGCAQAYLGVTPDRCTLGKALGERLYGRLRELFARRGLPVWVQAIGSSAPSAGPSPPGPPPDSTHSPSCRNPCRPRLPRLGSRGLAPEN